MVEYILVRSTPSRALPLCTPGVDDSMFELSTLKGRLSRLPPHNEDGAKARTEASVSIDRLRLLLLEDASVSIDALSVSKLFAVAVEYDVGLFGGARCAGIAEAGDVVGNGWLNWIDCGMLCG